MRKVYIDCLEGGVAPVYGTDPSWQAKVLSESGRLVQAKRTPMGVRVPLLSQMLDDILTRVEKADPQADIIIPWKRGPTFKKNELLIGLLIRARCKERR